MVIEALRDRYQKIERGDPELWERIKREVTRGEKGAADVRKVVGCVHRHTMQRPFGAVANTKWQWSLMTRGHDPLK